MVISSLGLGYIPAVWIFTDFLDSFDCSANIVLTVIGLVPILRFVYFYYTGDGAGHLDDLFTAFSQPLGAAAHAR